MSLYVGGDTRFQSTSTHEYTYVQLYNKLFTVGQMLPYCWLGSDAHPAPQSPLTLLIAAIMMRYNMLCQTMETGKVQSTNWDPTHCHNNSLRLSQRLRLWLSIKPTSGHCFTLVWHSLVVLTVGLLRNNLAPESLIPLPHLLLRTFQRSCFILARLGNLIDFISCMKTVKSAYKILNVIFKLSSYHYIIISITR